MSWRRQRRRTGVGTRRFTGAHDDPFAYAARRPAGHRAFSGRGARFRGGARGRQAPGPSAAVGVLVHDDPLAQPYDTGGRTG